MARIRCAVFIFWTRGLQVLPTWESTDGGQCNLFEWFVVSDRRSFSAIVKGMYVWWRATTQHFCTDAVMFWP